jgi:rhodanese-related sulfurtransferase
MKSLFLTLAFITFNLSSALSSAIADIKDFDPLVTEEVSIEQAKELWDAGKFDLILDVRFESEYYGSLGHLPDAKLIPVQSLFFRLDELEGFEDKTIGVICKSGVRSGWAISILRWKGFNKSVNIQGGTAAWVEKGYPVEHEEQVAQ